MLPHFTMFTRVILLKICRPIFIAFSLAYSLIIGTGFQVQLVAQGKTFGVGFVPENQNIFEQSIDC
jgi:hypothetical protein